VNPTSSELVTAIADALRNDIAPLLADQPWPASELRTIDALLAHLAVRIEHEDQVLRADNDELDALLVELADAGVPIVLDAADTSLAAGNLARRTALEAAIHAVHDGQHDQQVAAVRSYLRRAAMRERLLYQPFSERPLF